MPTYTPLPTIDMNLFHATKMSVDVVGSSIDGGRNSFGESQSIGLTGGGIVTLSYEAVVRTSFQHECINMLGARLNGSYRFINVPILNDFISPFDPDNAYYKGIPHSDGSLFIDDSGYSQGSAYGEFFASGALNAGVIRVRARGFERPLRISDWFSILHPTKGWRAYRYWQVLSVQPGNTPIYDLAISPPLREAVTAGSIVEFSRPRFVAKFPADFTLPWSYDLNKMDRPTVNFVEAF